MTDFQIDVVVDPSDAKRGLREVDNALKHTEGSADRLREVLHETFKLVGIGVGVHELIELVDEYETLENRLRVVTNSQEELIDVTEKLFKVNDETHGSIQGTVSLYTRLAQNSRELKLSQEELLGITETLNKAAVVSGTTAEESAGGINALSLAFANGSINGLQLRAVMRQLPAVADIIAKSLGVTRSSLKEMGDEGVITGEALVKAFKEGREEIAEKFAKTVPTAKQSLGDLKDKVLELVGVFSGQLSAGLADVVELLKHGVDALKKFTENEHALAISIGAAYVALVLFGHQLKILTAAGAVNPFVLIATAIASVILLLGKLDEELAKYHQSLEEIEKGGFTAFGALGDRIVEAEKDLKRLQKVMEHNPNEKVSAAIAQIQAKIRVLRGESNKYVEDAKKVDPVLTAQSKAFRDLVTDMDRQIAAFKLSNSEREIQNKLIVEENKLKGTGKEITADQSKEIENRLRLIQTLEFEANVLDSIKGPQQEHAHQLQVLDQLYSKGAITIHEYFKALEENANSGTPVNPDTVALVDQLRGGFKAYTDSILNAKVALAAGAITQGEYNQAVSKAVVLLADSDIYKSYLRGLDQEIALLKLGTKERAVQSAAIQVEQQLRAQGLFLNVAEKKALEDSIRLTQELAAQTEVKDKLLQDIRGPEEEHNRLVQAANDLYAEGKISLDEYNLALGNVAVESVGAGDALRDGILAGMEDIRANTETFAQGFEHTFVNAFGAAEDAIVQFRKTGEINFSALVDGILDDLTRLLARKALLGALEGLFPGSGSFFGLAGAKAEGGDVHANRPYLVGENGPEIFNPTTSGTVIPTDASMAALGKGQQAPAPQVNVQPPQVNVHITNVSDPKDALSALASPEGDKVIMNTISRNKGNVKRSLG